VDFEKVVTRLLREFRRDSTGGIANTRDGKPV